MFEEIKAMLVDEMSIDEDLITEKDTFDFSLQKFISKVNSQTISDREPKVSKDTNGKLVYTEDADEEALEKADYVTVSNEESAIAKVISDIEQGILKI